MGKAPLLGLVFAVLPVLAAEAAPATPDEAASLTTLFQRYVGTPAAGEPSSVTVSPDGDAYRVALDLKRALKGLESFGITVDPNVSITMLTPLPDGTWKVAATDSPPVVIHFREDSISVKAASATFDGIYDPKMSAFKTVDARYSGYDYSRTGPNLAQNSHTDSVTLTESGAPAEGGTVTETVHQSATGTRVDIVMRAISPPPVSATNPAVPPPPSPATQIGYQAPSSTVDVGLDKLHAKELLDLWAFLVAHPNHDSLVAAQDGLRGVLRAALPLVSGFNESASVAGGFAVTTPIGAFSAKTASSALAVANLDGAGKVTTSFDVSDLAVPAGQLPPWTRGLVPTAISLKFGAEGFHAADAAAEAVNDFDLKADEPLTPEQTAKIGHLALPGVALVTLMPSRLTSKLVDLKLDGQATLGEVPDGHLNVRATGLDKAIAALQAAAASDPSAAQALGPLVLAKNLAKPEADGSLSWLIALKGDGPVTVNGAPLQ